MDMQELKDIIRLLKEEGLSEITVADGDQRVTVKRDLQAAPIPTVSPAQPVLQSAPATSPEPAPDATLNDREFTLTAPLVGTFYRRPSPDDEPFVAVGDVVQAGDTICLIEAMKVMNEIKAEEAGRIRQVLLDDGEMVDFGKTLFILERL